MSIRCVDLQSAPNWRQHRAHAAHHGALFQVVCLSARCHLALAHMWIRSRWSHRSVLDWAWLSRNLQVIKVRNERATARNVLISGAVRTRAGNNDTEFIAAVLACCAHAQIVTLQQKHRECFPKPDTFDPGFNMTAGHFSDVSCLVLHLSPFLVSKANAGLCSLHTACSKCSVNNSWRREGCLRRNYDIVVLHRMCLYFSRAMSTHCECVLLTKKGHTQEAL